MESERLQLLEDELDAIEVSSGRLLADGYELSAQRDRQLATERSAGARPPALRDALDPRVHLPAAALSPGKGRARAPPPVRCTPSEQAALRCERHALARLPCGAELVGAPSLCPPGGALSAADVAQVLAEPRGSQIRVLAWLLERREGGFGALLGALREEDVAQFDLAANLQQAERDALSSAQRQTLADFHEATGGEGWSGGGGGGAGGWRSPLASLASWRGVRLVAGHVVQLKLPGSGLDGALPACIAQLRALEELQLSDNRLRGPIPAEISELRRLKNLVLSNNLLSGPIPSSVGRLQQLEFCSLRDNRLSGTVPDSIRGCACLAELYLHNNRLERVDECIAMLKQAFGDELLFRVWPQAAESPAGGRS
jgi:hypothetical protein